MTKPKEYPLNRKGWVVIEVRRQGGNWDKCLRPVILTKGEKRYMANLLDPVFYIKERVNPRTGERKYTKSFNTVNDSKDIHIRTGVTRSFCRKHNLDYPYYFGTEGIKDKRILIGEYVCDLFYQLGRVPTRVELKKYILQNTSDVQIQRDLGGPDTNSYMRRLMHQCMLEWLPTSSRGKTIIELPPPYGCKNSFIVTLSQLFWRKLTGCCSLKLFFQLEREEEWPPPKRKRGRPRKYTKKE